MQITSKRIQDFTSRWVMGWISKPWEVQGQLLPTTKRADPSKSELLGVVTRLKSSLVEFSHPLDQCLQARRQFRLLPLIINMRRKEVFVRPLRFRVNFNKEPPLRGVCPSALEGGVQVFFLTVAMQRHPNSEENLLVILGWTIKHQNRLVSGVITSQHSHNMAKQLSIVMAFKFRRTNSHLRKFRIDTRNLLQGRPSPAIR
jgi:hypothetical protein